MPVVFSASALLSSPVSLMPKHIVFDEEMDSDGAPPDSVEVHRQSLSRLTMAGTSGTFHASTPLGAVSAAKNGVVLSVAASRAGADGGLLAAALSSGTVQLYSWQGNSGAMVQSHALEAKKPTSVKFPLRSELHLLFATSESGELRVFDTRTGAVAMRLGPTPDAGPLWSCDAAEHRVAAGAAETVLVWDRRNLGAPLTTLEDAHGDAVTQCRFAPGTPSLLLSCSVDGQVSVSDLTAPDPYDAFKACINTFDSLADFDFYGPSLSSLWVRSHTEALYFWDWKDALREDGDGGASFASFKEAREGLREASKASEAACGEEQADYLLGCWWDSSEERLCAVAGSNSGSVGVFPLSVEKDRVTAGPPVLGLSGGHTTVVRAVEWLPDEGGRPWTCVSGGEDGRLCLWSAGSGGRVGADAGGVSGARAHGRQGDGVDKGNKGDRAAVVKEARRPRDGGVAKKPRRHGKGSYGSGKPS